MFDGQKLNLGSYPPRLSLLAQPGQRLAVFAGCDRPAILYMTPSAQKKLSYSFVNMRDVICVCPVFSAAYPDSYVFSAGDRLVIGAIDSIQKLHVRTVPLGGEMPRRITYMQSRDKICLLTVRGTPSGTLADLNESAFVRLIEPHSMECLDTFELVCSTCNYYY